MAIFDKPAYGTNRPPVRTKKKEIPQGLWTKCPSCGEVLFNKELEDNLMVCPKCEHHMTLSARARLLSVADPDSFEETDAALSSVDILKFTGVTSYPERLKNYRKKTGLNEAVVSGNCRIDGRQVSVAAMDFNFLGGSMGSVVGEKITRAIERGAEQKLPVVVFSASGGARMYEGMFSLMQLAKTSAALARLAQRGQPFISVLTNPTMAGVMASYASLGDLIIAEPKAMIGFAGARVIKETTQQQLPKGFQTAEFLLDRGLIDHIVPRRDMRDMLAKFLGYLAG
ncbi:MAG: acetyl-CoA carboxylase, carboxyltransferase subunit beta [Candidatus Methylacidiphilales bacterium]|nr:acetyl-CoA carboxylase, carboxyltransferase subunit beta [Candidatus Methylacidiphilales bacterium]